ncbi:hypothetical protein [Winogradskyella ursingii]|uniref:hypothetical protein n=1 Tax=Winogradskyella ursingii TaxID=2686079 RepID=UPI001FE2688D|nr:hypothetical protein [Winogradskyella ursingii]
MRQKLRHSSAVFFTILFVALLSAPTIITSFDDSIDISFFYSLSEEEENEKNFKLVFETDSDSEIFFDAKKRKGKGIYKFKKYPKPHLNLVSPPPEFIS